MGPGKRPETHTAVAAAVALPPYLPATENGMVVSAFGKEEVMGLCGNPVSVGSACCILPPSSPAAHPTMAFKDPKIKWFRGKTAREILKASADEKAVALRHLTFHCDPVLTFADQFFKVPPLRAALPAVASPPDLSCRTTLTSR